MNYLFFQLHLSKAFRSCLEMSEQTPKISVCTHGCTCIHLVIKEQEQSRATGTGRCTLSYTAVEQWSL